MRVYRDHAANPVVSIRTNRYSTTFDDFFDILLVVIRVHGQGFFRIVTVIQAIPPS
jgi:hypothetical protein